MKMKKQLSLFLLATLCISTIACGKQSPLPASNEEEIELLEPVNAAVSTEAAAYRNLYDATIYSSYVVPYTEEYSFAKDTKFDHFGAYPGQNVSKGSALIYSNTDDIDKQLEGLDKTVENLEKSLENYNWNIDDQIDEKLFYSSLNYERFGDTVDVQLMCHDVFSLRLQKEQYKALYDLDHEHYLNQIANLKKEKQDNALSSYMDGCVVSMASYSQGSKVSRDIPIVAVGNMNQKILRSEYINNATISKAKDLYAIVDGVRYEIENQSISSEEYSKLTAKGETVYSSFTFVGETPDIQIGDYAALILVKDLRIQCLSVPNSAIHKDENGSFVYVMENGSPVNHTIRTGMSDGVYTEVIEGIRLNDMILLDKAPEYSDTTAKVSHGDFHTDFNSKGEAYYPSQTSVINEIEYGTVYYISYEAALYQHVNKGDTIATVTVSPNSIELDRKNTELGRLKERREDIDTAWKEICDESYKAYAERDYQPDKEADHVVQHDIKLNRKSAEQMDAQIKDLEDEIAKIQAAYNTTKIVAPASGIIIQQAQYADHDIIPYDSVLAVIANESSCFISVDNTNQLLNCGNEVTISYSDEDRNSHSLTGTVVTVANLATSNAMNSETVLVSIPAEAVADITAALILPPGMKFDDYNASWFDDWRKMFTIKAEVRQMNGVLTVPKNAVWEISGKTYVYVKNSDGSVVASSFISGGHDSNNYWIVDGLEEGTEVCLK